MTFSLQMICCTLRIGYLCGRCDGVSSGRLCPRRPCDTLYNGLSRVVIVVTGVFFSLCFMIISLPPGDLGVSMELDSLSGNIFLFCFLGWVFWVCAGVGISLLGVLPVVPLFFSRLRISLAKVR